jgi:hypothetical protein
MRLPMTGVRGNETGLMTKLTAHAAYATPSLIAAGLILTEFADGNAGHWTTLVRPLAVAMVGAAALEAVASSSFDGVTGLSRSPQY